MNRSQLFLFRMASALGGALAVLVVRAVFRALRKPSAGHLLSLEGTPEGCAFGSDPGLFERLASAP